MTEVVIADPIRNLLLMGMLNQVQHDGVLFSMTKAVIAGLTRNLLEMPDQVRHDEGILSQAQDDGESSG